MEIFLGYLLSYLYLIVLFVAALFVEKRLNNKVIARKIVHTLTFFVLFIPLYFWGENSMHNSILAFSLLGLIMIKEIISYIKDKEHEFDLGIFLYTLIVASSSLISFFFRNFYPYFIFGYACLAFGDGLAGVLGTYFPIVKIYKNKSLGGFLSNIIFAFIAMLILDLCYTHIAPIYFLAVFALISAIIELNDFSLDNVLVPGAVMLTLFLYGQEPTLIYAYIVFVGVFLIGYFLKIMTYYGALLAGFIGLMFYHFAGLYSLLFVLGNYIVLLVIAIISKVKKNDLSDIVNKTKGKDIIQVFVNGGFPLLFLVIYAIVRNPIFIIMALITFSASFTDSIASDVGSMSKKAPYDIFKKKVVPMGMSGGITFLGTFSAVLYAFICGLVITFITNTNIWLLFLYGGLMIIGIFVDTMLGSLVQVKFKCQVCDKITEKTIHHEKETLYYEGVKFINNDTVNFISSLCVAILSFILFIIF